MRRPKQAARFSDLLKDRADEIVNAHRSDAYRTFVIDCQLKYRHWDKVRVLARAQNLDPDIAWALIDMGRSGQIKTLPLRCEEGQPLRYMIPDIVQRHLMRIDQRLAGRIDFGGEQPLSEPERQRIIYTSLHEEAITSSMLEGAATTRREAEDLLATGREPRSTGEKMVLNNYKTIEFIRQHRSTPLTPGFIIELQTMLTRDTLEHPHDVGRVRTKADDIKVVDERTGEVVHYPPPAEELDERLERLCLFANDTDSGSHDDAKFIHPVIRAATLHFQLAYDHPFCDGNGRTARALFYWSMLCMGYYLFEYLPISRFIYRAPAKYVKAFLYTETDDFDLTYFLVYHMRIIAEATSELEQHIQEQRRLAAKNRREDRPSGTNYRQWLVIQDLRHSPAQSVTVQSCQSLTGSSYGTARNDLISLQAMGLVKRIKVGRQFRFFLA